MTFDYVRSQGTALRLIKRFGQRGAVRAITPGAGPAHNPGPSTTVDHPADLAVIDYATFERDGTRIQINDKRAYIAAQGLPLSELNTGHKVIEADGTVWSIVRASALKPAGVVVCWDAQVRR